MSERSEAMSAEDPGALRAFFDELAAAHGTPVLDEAEAEAVLDLTRVVAHTAERRFAPLTAYVAALAWGSEDVRTRVAHLREVAAHVRERHA